MIIKPRYESDEFKILKCLHGRVTFSKNEENHYVNLEKGFAGEKRFDSWLEKHLSNNLLILNDLLLDLNNTLFQIDTLVISPNTLYLFELKNYEGDYCIDEDRWYTLGKSEIKNPLLQLKRNESLLRRLLQDLGFSYPLEAYLIFINPHFHLYQTPLHLPIIFPTQLSRFLHRLNLHSSSPFVSDPFKLANHLVSIHLHQSPFNRIPTYHYEELKKGIRCASCLKLNTIQAGTKIICADCAFEEKIPISVLRSIQEYSELFPNKNITTANIHDWCRIIKSQKTIRKILSANYKQIGKTKSAYFIKNE